MRVRASLSLSYNATAFCTHCYCQQLCMGVCCSEYLFCHVRPDSPICVHSQCSTENGKGFRRGSGFITEIEIKGQRKCLLITCNHVLQSQSDALNADISFGRVGDSREETIIKGKDLFHDFFKTDDNDVSSLCWGVHHVSCL